MKIQSLSVVVPNRQCIMRCKSCPSRMHGNDYDLLLDEYKPDFHLHLQDYLKRLEFARDNGCNTLMLTGTSEPQQNRRFLTWFGMMMQIMKNPFRSIEMQCTGALIDDEYIEFLRNHVGLTAMALSVFSLDSDENKEVICPPKNISVDIYETAKKIKNAGMALRMCLNLTNHFDRFATKPGDLFEMMKTLYHADQVTFRILYADVDDTPENLWVRQNAASQRTADAIRNYIKIHGILLGKLPYGASKFDVHGMSVVIDDDCMGKEPDDIDTYKYLILRPDCKLYSSWDSTASLVF